MYAPADILSLWLSVLLPALFLKKIKAFNSGGENKFFKSKIQKTRRILGKLTCKQLQNELQCWIIMHQEVFVCNML